MLEETHLRIADKIADELGLGKKEKKLLGRGSIDPDAWGEWPHHREKEQTILEHIFSARKKFLQEDDECFHDLGVALHFLQDHWTLTPRTHNKHTKYEYELDKAKIVGFEQLIGVIQDATMPEKAIKTYVKLAQTLSRIFEKGIEQWYDGIWKYGLKNLHLVDVSQHKPAVTGGLGAAIARLSLLHLPFIRDAPLEKDFLLDEMEDEYFEIRKNWETKQTVFRKWGTPTIDLNVAYWICRVISKYVIQPLNRKSDQAWHSINGLDDIVRHLAYPWFSFYSHEGWRKKRKEEKDFLNKLKKPWWRFW